MPHMTRVCGKAPPPRLAIQQIRVRVRVGEKKLTTRAKSPTPGAAARPLPCWATPRMLHPPVSEGQAVLAGR